MKTIVACLAFLELCAAVAILPITPFVVKPLHHPPILHLTAPLYGYTYAISPTAVHLYTPGVAVAAKEVPIVIGKDVHDHVPVVVKHPHVPVVAAKEVPLFVRKEVLVPVVPFGSKGSDIPVVFRKGVTKSPKRKNGKDGGDDSSSSTDDDDEKEELKEKEAVSEKDTETVKY